jgi:hypothetical protein
VILESIVTSVDREGRVNIAPMGPRVDDNLSLDDPRQLSFVLRPFDSSLTYRNLIETRKAVIHVTDDAELFAKAAVDALGCEQSAQLVQQLGDSDWWPLRDCHRWFAVAVEAISDDHPRVDMQCRVIESKSVRPFFGFNRAKHAVIEAAILATRTHILQPQEILAEIDRLQPLIDKTAGPSEHSAFDLLRKTIHARIASR